MKLIHSLRYERRLLIYSSETDKKWFFFYSLCSQVWPLLEHNQTKDNEPNNRIKNAV